MNVSLGPSLEPPTWDRNLGDDIDEELDFPPPSYKPPGAPIFAAANPDEDLSCDILLVAVHSHACTFLSAVVDAASSELESEMVASLLLPEVPLACSSPAAAYKCVPDGAPTCNVYKLSPRSSSSAGTPSIMLVVARQPVSNDRAADWAQELFNNIKAQRVLVLDSIKDVNYCDLLPNNNSVPPILRCVETSANKARRAEAVDEETKNADAGKPKAKKKKLAGLVCPFLEMSNILSGPTAAIISHCEVYNVAAEAVISIASSNYQPECLLAFEDAVSAEHIGVSLLPGHFPKLDKQTRASFYSDAIDRAKPSSKQAQVLRAAMQDHAHDTLTASDLYL